MPTPVYADVLTRESAARLAALVRDLPQPVALAGGHAVRHVVRDLWERRFGEEYFGSRDIDVCYLVEPHWTEAEFRASAAGQAPLRIREIGYKPMGVFRFGLWVDNDGKALDREPGPPKMLAIDYHVLAIDPMVTHVHPLSKKVLGFHPIDEPLLGRAFHESGLRTAVDGLGPSVYVPTTSLLSATKLKSLPDRDKEDKAIKDLCDLYALTAFGGSHLAEVRRVVHRVLPDARGLVDAALRHDSLPRAVEHLAITLADYRAAVGPLALPP